MSRSVLLTAIILGALAWSHVVAAQVSTSIPAASASSATPKAPRFSRSTLQACLGARVTWTERDGTSGEGIVVRIAATRIQIHLEDSARRDIATHNLLSLKLLEAAPIGQLELRNAIHQQVWVKLRNGSIHRGELMAYDSHSIALIAQDQRVLGLSRGDIIELKTRAEKRQYGLNLSLLPGLMIDIDRGLFRGYINGALALPAALNGKLWGLSTGLGVGLPVLPSSKSFKLDIMANVNVMGVASACSACNYPTAHVFGFGLAAGFHDTLSNGFTYGMTVPLIGYSVAPNYVGSTNAHVGHYYISSAVAMPLAFVGYRL